MSDRLSRKPELRDQAVYLPNVARSLLGTLTTRGVPPDRVCRGLGFHASDLLHPEFRLSYRQVRALVLRGLELVGDTGLGLAAGARQGPVSWGLPGLAMLTCETLEEAMSYALAHLGDSGALLEASYVEEDESVVTTVRPRFHDREIEPFLVEEAFASAISVMRQLAGVGLSPRWVELAYRAPPHAAAYGAFFRGQVRFGCEHHRMALEKRWLDSYLTNYDPLNSRPLRAQLDRLLARAPSRADVIESVGRRLRASLEERVLVSQVAREFSMSERTLRRRLNELDTSFRALLDEARRERADELVHHTTVSLSEIAAELGFSDVRSFRRAYVRWTGQLPAQARRTNM